MVVIGEMATRNFPYRHRQCDSSRAAAAEQAKGRPLGRWIRLIGKSAYRSLRKALVLLAGEILACRTRLMMRPNSYLSPLSRLTGSPAVRALNWPTHPVYVSVSLPADDG